MAKKTSDASTDAALNYIKDNVEIMYLCSAEPADYAGISAVALADVAVGSADLTVGAGTGGRQYEVAQKSGITIDSSGDVTHIVLAKDSATSELLDVTTCTSTAVSTGGSATVNSWTRLIQDPS